MKLSALNSAIRALPEAPIVNTRYWRGEGFEVALSGLRVQKQSLLEALKRAFPEGRNQETHLILLDGELKRDEATWPTDMDAPPGFSPEALETESVGVVLGAEPIVDVDDDPLGLGIPLTAAPAEPANALDDLLG